MALNSGSTSDDMEDDELQQKMTLAIVSNEAFVFQGGAAQEDPGATPQGTNNNKGEHLQKAEAATEQRVRGPGKQTTGRVKAAQSQQSQSRQAAVQALREASPTEAAPEEAPLSEISDSEAEGGKPPAATEGAQEQLGEAKSQPCSSPSPQQ